MKKNAIQDFYPDDLSHGYGCGRLNEEGLRIRSVEDGEETRSVFEPRPGHKAIPGSVYGSLLASLIACHCTGTAAIPACRAQGREMGRG